MGTSQKIKGNKLALKLGAGVGAKDYWADLSACTLQNEDSDDVLTFYDASMGGVKQWFFEITAVTSTATESFWRYVWENTGAEVAFTFAPHKNETASAEQPHFIGTVKIPAKPSMGGEASLNGAFTFETRFDVIGEPTLDVGTP